MSTTFLSYQASITKNLVSLHVGVVHHLAKTPARTSACGYSQSASRSSQVLSSAWMRCVSLLSSARGCGLFIQQAVFHCSCFLGVVVPLQRKLLQGRKKNCKSGKVAAKQVSLPVTVLRSTTPSKDKLGKIIAGFIIRIHAECSDNSNRWPPVCKSEAYRLDF